MRHERNFLAMSKIFLSLSSNLGQASVLTSEKVMKQKAKQLPQAPTVLPRVFIIQQPKPKADGWTPSFDSAAKYGSLHFVYDQHYRAQSDPQEAQDLLPEVLGDFNPDIDYLLATIFGDPATVWVVLCWLAPLLKKQGYPAITFLYWSRGKGENGYTNDNGYYLPCRIPL